MYEAEHIPGLPPQEPQEPSIPTKTLVIIGVLLVGALGFIIFGLGYALGWWSGEDEQTVDPMAVVARDEPQEAEPELFGAEPIPDKEGDEPAPVRNDGPLFGAEPIPEVAAEGGEGAEGERASGKRGGGGGGGGPNPMAGGGPRVAVEFVLVHYDSVELKLGGKVFRLSGNKTLQIRPGGYRVQLRRGPDQSWTSAGLVSVELGSKYRVKLFDPPLAKTERLDR